MKIYTQACVGVSDAMDGSFDLSRLGAVVFHDVDLAPARPRHAVVAHHPEGRPDGLAGGNLDSRFDSAIGELFAEAAVELGLDSRREIGAAGKVGLDHQMAVAVQE